MIKSCVGGNEFRFIRWRSDNRIDARRVWDGTVFLNVLACTFLEDEPGEIEGEVRRLKEIARQGK